MYQVIFSETTSNFRILAVLLFVNLQQVFQTRRKVRLSSFSVPIFHPPTSNDAFISHCQKTKTCRKYPHGCHVLFYTL